MSALEQEIIEKFRSLDEESQRRVLLEIERVRSVPHDKRDAEKTWLEQARALREEMSRKYGNLNLSIADLINEVREERLDDLMTSLTAPRTPAVRRIPRP